MTTQITLRKGTASQWTSANPTLASGEIGYETDTNQFKFGDGTTAWNSLKYFINSDSPTFTGTVTLPSTTSIGNVDLSELSYLDGVTSNVQTQLDSKLNITSASSTYLTQTSASSTYLTQDNATSTYLTQANASTTYATRANPTFTGTVTTPNLLVQTTVMNPQPTPAVVNATATLTIANLLSGIITTTSATAVGLTLPTGTLTETGLGTLAVTDTAFYWSIINLGSSTGAITISNGASHTFVGNATVAISTSARFATRRTAANTYVTYRLS